MPELLSRISNEQKRAALDAALQSKTLGRAEQLKSLLRYLVEKEIAGEASLLTEYQIGVEGIGLPSTYAPGEDSTVRNRTYTLRRKLEDLYRTELTATALQIEFPKGSYVPRFVEATPAPAPAIELPRAEAPAPTKASRWPILLAFAAGLAIAGAAWWATTPARSPIDPLLREAWGPLLDPDANAVVCVATSPQMPVREVDGIWKPLEGEPMLDAPPNVTEWYRRLRPAAAGKKIFLLPTYNSVGLGDALGAAAATRLLATAGATFQVVPERVVPLAAMRKRNVVLMGGSVETQSIQYWLKKAPFSTRFNPETGDISIMESTGQKRIFAARRNAKNQLIEAYGLLTVVPSEGSDGQQRTIAVVGTYTAGVQAAMDFFTSPRALGEFKQALQGAPFPKAYQVVVRTTVEQMLPLTQRYATHALIED